MRRLGARLGLALALLAAPFPAARALLPLQVPIGPDLAKLGWQSLTFDGIPATGYTGSKDGVLEVRADRSASVLYRPLTDVDLAGAHVLQWDWQVVDGLPPTDLEKRGGDDRALALHVWFYPRDGDAGLMARLGAAVTGMPPGRMLTYVWGGEQPVGSMFANPHNPEKGRMIVLRGSSAPLGTWLHERIDLAGDYAHAFGGPAPKPAVIAVSGDSDDLGRVSLGRVRGLHFTAE